MQGIRPGSAAAIAAGYVPPGRRRPTRRPGGASFTPSFNADGTTTLTAPKPPATPTATAPPPTSAAPPPVPSFTPTSSWWMSQLAADPRYITAAPVFEEQRAGIGRSYGFRIARDDQGRPLYKTAAGGKNITQQLDDKGAIVYKDTEGNVYKPGDLQLDITRVGKGEQGYLEGQLGSAEAGSEARRFRIGEQASQAGIRRSGMEAATTSQELAGLQSAIAGLTTRAGTELAGVDEKYANLYREIYGDLAKRASELAAGQPGAPAPEAPEVITGPQTSTASAGPPIALGVPIPQAPLEQPRSINIAGQSVTFPKGINLKGVDVTGIGNRIANNIRAAGGVNKLRNGQRVGEFRAGDKGYRVFYRNGKFVIELIG